MVENVDTGVFLVFMLVVELWTGSLIRVDVCNNAVVVVDIRLVFATNNPIPTINYNTYILKYTGD